jgi:hypothetical protein
MCDTTTSAGVAPLRLATSFDDGHGPIVPLKV